MIVLIILVRMIILVRYDYLDYLGEDDYLEDYYLDGGDSGDYAGRNDYLEMIVLRLSLDNDFKIILVKMIILTEVTVVIMQAGAHRSLVRYGDSHCRQGHSR